jgi:hypothetical protein
MVTLWVATHCRPTECTSGTFYGMFHKIFYMYMFRTGGLIFRHTTVTNTGTVQYISTCMVQSGTSQHSYRKAATVLYLKERERSITCKSESSHDCCLLGYDAVESGTKALTDSAVFIIRFKWTQFYEYLMIFYPTTWRHIPRTANSRFVIWINRLLEPTQSL